jgi:hypothetical protein
MNRIRQKNNKYQVLLTPHHKFDYNIEFLLGNWSDPYLASYKVIEYNTMEEAMNTSYQYPNLDWELIVLHHKDIFIQLKKIIRDTLTLTKMSIHFKSTLTDPLILKNVMFDRVLNYGNRFNLNEKMNDIINFTIINPWTQNLVELQHILQSIPRLRIQSVLNTNGIITMIGKTDIGTSYSITLIPSLLEQWINMSSSKNIPQDIKNAKLIELLRQQQQIDKSGAIR